MIFIKKHRPWDIPERETTPEAVFFNRRAFLKNSLVGAAAGAAASSFLPSWLNAKTQIAPELYPARHNTRYTVTRPITPFKLSSTYNNFYEFGSHKRIFKAAQKLSTDPWTIVVDGEAHNTGRVAVENLIRSMPLEERVYRHRCVEGWAMIVPWTGFPLAALVALAEPKSSARFLRMESFFEPSVARSQKQHWYPWPYSESVTIKEALNELAFLVTGVYGRPLPNQFGAPLRLALPWKYGFKSIKSITRFSFVKKQPVSFWEYVNEDEYGFWANVNPHVPHPRWSQRKEQLLGTKKYVSTRIFNGYARYVSSMYPMQENNTALWR